MYLPSWFFSLILMLNNIVIKPPDAEEVFEKEISPWPKHYTEFEFKNIILGHTGFLITWEPKNKTHNANHSKLHFKISYRIKNGQEGREASTAGSIECDFNQYKIHSLKEDTLYEVIIEQYSSDMISLENKYSFDMKTNCKTNIKPEKPDFKYYPNNNSRIYPNQGIQWLPCGIERNCDGKEAGTDFAVKIKLLDRRAEYRTEVIQSSDYVLIHIMPGVLHEVSVISINNHFETESDSQQIFVTPTIGAVTAIKVASFPNASVLVSWKPPKHSLEKLYEYKIIVADSSHFIEDEPIFFPYRINNLSKIVNIDASIEKILFDKPEYQLEPGVTYTFSIIPRGEFNFGFETRVKYTIPVGIDD